MHGINIMKFFKYNLLNINKTLMEIIRIYYMFKLKMVDKSDKYHLKSISNPWMSDDDCKRRDKYYYSNTHDTIIIIIR